MDLSFSPLTAISPVDGRYENKTRELAPYFSEFGLIHYRVRIEIEYFIFLAEIGIFEFPNNLNKNDLKSIYQNFSEKDALAIKETEKTTNHDVKAVEYFIKGKLVELNAESVTEWVHFGLTSQDINNTAIPLLWKDVLAEVLFPSIINISGKLQKLATEWSHIPMLARTHGQPASPTVLGKELMVFVERINMQLSLISKIPYSAKFGGATGNFNAHQVAFPKYDWIQLSNQFVNDILGLSRDQYTTQIEHYDNLAGQLDGLKRINTILIDLCRDIWTYISQEYFKQKTVKNEVGSSAMPHKVNPIDFENAEGNLGISTAIYEHLSHKLPISRLQRDLTDSTVLRMLGVPVAHALIAIKSLEKGLNKLLLNESKIEHDLDENWAVVAEAIQTILRREGYPKPYEALKDLTRGKNHISKADIQLFIESLKVDEDIKSELLAISPHNYIGIHPKI